MKAHNYRCYNNVEAKPEGVTRILCIGDSFTYGEGVLSHQTLPAQLEYFLNRTLWSRHIEVVNFGRCGNSVYEDWHEFVHFGCRYNPDLVIIVLFENDAELFQAKDDYTQHVRDSWDEGNIYLPYFRHMMEDIRTDASDNRVNLLVTYYDTSGSEIKFKIASQLTGICAEYGIDFCDISKDFEGQSSAMHNDNLYASSEDHHPSAFAHRIAAQRLARHIVANKRLGGDDNGPLPEDTLHGTLFRNAGDMLCAGYRPEVVLNSLSDLLKTKRESRARLDLPDSSLLPDEVFRDRIGSLEDVSLVYRRLMFWDGYSQLFLGTYSMSFWQTAVFLEDMIIHLSKMLFVLEQNLKDPGLKYNPYENVSGERMGAPDVTSNIYEESISASMVMLSDLRKCIISAGNGGSDLLRPFYDEFLARHRLTAARMMTILDKVETIGASVLNMFGFFSMLAGTYGIRDGGNGHIMKGVYIDLTSLGSRFSTWLQQLRINTLAEQFTAGNLEPFVHCRVTARSSSKDRSVLLLALNAITPCYQTIHDTHHMIRDGEFHTYTYRFPLFSLGCIHIHAMPTVDYQIREISIFNDETKPMNFTPDRLQSLSAGTYATPVLLVQV